MVQAGLAQSSERDSFGTQRFIWRGALLGVILVILALGLMIMSGAARTMAIMLIILFSAGAAGGLLGFIFAVPRVITRTPADKAGDGSIATDDATAGKLLSTNTNLERISDWLTTMLVGVGLTQIGNINTYLLAFSAFLKTQTPPVVPCKTAVCGLDTLTSYLPMIGPMLLIIGFVAGFIVFYLFMRLTLVPEFNKVEQHLTGAPEKAIKKLANTVAKSSDSLELSALVSGRSPTIDEALNIMLEALYIPGAFSRVIDLSATLVNTPTAKRPEYWYYLAAAFGQKYTDIAETDHTNEREDNLQSARDNAMDCARRAVQIDPAYKEKLWSISTAGAFDDDLAPLHNDPEFRRLTGHPDA